MSDAFTDSSFITLIVCLMYLIDVSNTSTKEKKNGTEDAGPELKMINDS
jgi:hypothetical protein